jgi:hypothetical protein
LPVSVFAGIGGDKGAKLFNTKENSVLSESCFMID